MSLFQSIQNFQSTRDTLQFYSTVLAEISKSHGIAHPQWRHISLKVRPNGLATDNIPLPGGGIMSLRMDIIRHLIIIETSQGFVQEIDMTGGADNARDDILKTVNDLGLSGEYNAKILAPQDNLIYEPEKSESFFHTVVEVDRVFKKHLTGLPDPVSPVQLWPHGFDLSCEWYGGRMEKYEENGQIQRIPTQLNLGFYPGANDDESYFYSNPWPFAEDQLLSHSLPTGARWHTEGWKGSILPYIELVNDPDAEMRLLEFARAVHTIAAPTLN